VARVRLRGERSRRRLEAATPGAPPVAHQVAALRAVRTGTNLLEVDVPGWWAALPVSRELAMSLPTIAAGRNLICGTVAQLDVRRFRGADQLEPGSLLTQPDPDSVWPVTIAETVDDLIFYGRAAWLVLAYDGQATDRNPSGLPVRARRVPPTQWSARLSSDLAAYTRLEGYTVGASELEPDALITFDAGHEGLLTYGAGTLSAGYALELAARRHADVELPAGVLENTGHELSAAEAAVHVAAFQAARREHTVAFLQGLKYSREALMPADLQLVEARAIAATDQARLLNVPVAMVAASPTGGASAMLYANLGATQALLLTQAVAPLLRVIEATLSTDQVTPRGQAVAFSTSQWLRADPQAAADSAVQLAAAGIITTPEARGYLGIPSTVPPDLTPGRV
jgi:hypothetical protein